MKLKFKKDRGRLFASGKFGWFQYKGYAGAWWCEYHSNIQSVSPNLGWAPTQELAKKRCQDLEDYFEKRGTDRSVNNW